MDDPAASRRTEPAAPVHSPGLTVAAVARRLGVAPATLRTWARRYDLGPSSHVAGAHRRYSPEDLARLDLMRRMVNSGVGPGDAARAARSASAELLAPQWARPLAVVTTDPVGATEPAPPSSAPSAWVRSGLGPRDEPPGAGRDRYDPPVGRHVLALPGAIPAARGLARAAMAMDGTACSDLVQQSVERAGVAWTWDNLLVPVLSGLGRRWESTGEGVEVEHLLSELIVAVMSSVSLRPREHRNARPVLLACAEEEAHALPLVVIAAALGEQQVSARVLGARVPDRALVAAIRRTGPAVVLVWSRRTATGDLAALAGLTRLRPAPLLLAAGPGWHGVAPEQVEPGRDLTDVVARICAVVD